MSRGVNKVILVGNLGADPEVRYMPSGGAVANLRLATSEAWKDRQSGQVQEKTEWHKVVLFNRLGEIAGEYLKKGSKVYIEGSLRTTKWQDQQGQDRYTTEIVGSSMQMLDSKGGFSGDNGGSFSGSNSSQKSNNFQSGNANNAKSSSGLDGGTANATSNMAETEFMDDDIPF